MPGAGDVGVGSDGIVPSSVAVPASGAVAIPVGCVVPVATPSKGFDPIGPAGVVDPAAATGGNSGIAGTEGKLFAASFAVATSAMGGDTLDNGGMLVAFGVEVVPVGPVAVLGHNGAAVVAAEGDAVSPVATNGGTPLAPFGGACVTSEIAAAGPSFIFTYRNAPTAIRIAIVMIGRTVLIDRPP